VTTAGLVVDGLAQVEQHTPKFAVTDIKLSAGSGLEIISALMRYCPGTRAIIRAGYGNIATAVNAVKVGATDYLKTGRCRRRRSGTLAQKGGKAQPPVRPMSAGRV
jgi:two-component system, response regulator RegA